MDWWQIAASVVGGFLALWLVLVGFLLWCVRNQPDQARWRDALRLVPDVVRLLRRLAADRSLPRSVRFWLVALLVYLICPVDIIPDFIPVLGVADDAIVVAIVLRFVTRHAGTEALERHWPGTPQGLQALRSMAGLHKSPA